MDKRFEQILYKSIQINNKYTKKMLNDQKMVTREMQIKTTMRYYYIPSRIVKNKTLDITKLPSLRM